MYKLLLAIGALLLPIFWPVGLGVAALGLFFRNRAITQQANFMSIIRLKPNCQPEQVDINYKNSGWKFDGKYYINRLSSIKFPQQFGRVLGLTNILVYDDLGENCSIGYQSIVSGFYVTTYIYKAHSNDLSGALEVELENIAASYPEFLMPSNQEFWGVDAETAGHNLNFADASFISTAFCYGEGNIKVKSFIVLTQFAGNYVKLRVTWPSDSDFPSKTVLSTLRGVLMDITVLNQLDIFGIKPAVPI